MIKLNRWSYICKYALIIACIPVVFSCEYYGDMGGDSSSLSRDQRDRKQNSSRADKDKIKRLERKLNTIEKEMAERDRPSGGGSGYLSGGSTVSLGVFGEEGELRVLDKVKKMERTLEVEIKKRKAIEQYLSEINAEKEKVKKKYESEKKKHKEESKSLTAEIKALKLQQKDFKTRVVAAESVKESLEEQVLKLRIADTKMQQELFKYKIKQLEEKEEQ